MNTVTTNCNAETKLLDIDELKKMFDELKELPKPQALILIPGMKGFDMYKVDAKTAELALKICRTAEKHNLFDLMPKGLVKVENNV